MIIYSPSIGDNVHSYSLDFDEVWCGSWGWDIGWSQSWTLGLTDSKL